MRNFLIFLGLSFTFITWVCLAETNSYGYKSGGRYFPGDTTKKNKSKRPDYTPDDRQGDPFSNPRSKSPLLLPLPNNIKTDVILDDSLKTYTIDENIGEHDYRAPSTMTFEEYQKYKTREMMRNYWKSKTGGADNSVTNNDPKSLVPKLRVSGLSGPFGSDYIEIRPTGLVTLDFGARWQRVANPNIPVRQQRQGQFDFDQTISMNVVGKIGEKLKLTTNWDTKAAFEFQNNLKLEFTGFPEDIIQKIEAGNVSMPLNSTLISGAQNLFGVKTKLQFGRLSATAVMATQRGKVEQINIQGGAQSREFEIKGDNYDDYRHFFLSHFFRDNYEKSLRSTPSVLSGVKITRVQVWLTNRVNNTNTLKSFAAFTDLGEADTTDMFRKTKFWKHNIPQAVKDSSLYPSDNSANTLFAEDTTVRRNADLITAIQGAPYDLVRGTDFELIDQARQLAPTEFSFHPDLGYISLNTQVRPDEVLAVAFEYTYLGKTYKVGEMTEDFTAVPDGQPVVLKLLKPTTIKTRLPTWDLMMKNVYQLGGTALTRDNFQLRVIYKNDLTGADLPTLQEGKNTTAIPLLRLTGLDRLNPNNDPYHDGNFDYVEGVTIDSRNGRIFFPVLEPFGSAMEKYFDPNAESNLIKKYVYSELYDSTKSDAQQFAQKDKYYLKGRYQSGSSSEIVLPGINIAPGSVTVLAGSTPLVEGQDYDIDYNLGRLRIKNQGVLQSNQQISVRFEKQDFINFRRKSFMGTRLEYKVGRDFLIGSTVLHQTESPNISRVNIGDEPSSNTIVGLDANVKAESRFITKMIDKLPIIQTKAISSVNFAGEGAMLLPGYPKLLNKSGNEGGTSYIDDFEGSETPYDLTRIPTKWRLGATPLRFPESSSSNLDYAFNRAKMAWFDIDQIFYTNTPSNFKGTSSDSSGKYHLKNYFVKKVIPQEIYRNRDQQQITVPEPLLNLVYFPKDRGPYNYNPNFFSATPLEVSKRWASITREIRNDIDFDNANIQYVEFWMMDPYMNNNSELGKLPLGMDPDTWDYVKSKGELYINLGSISEDVMKDGQHAFENGLPVSNIDANEIQYTTWGKVTKKQFLTNAFDNSSDSRGKQDVGLDGLNDKDEQSDTTIFKHAYANIDDPSADNFHYYLGDDLGGKGILERYKSYNGLENNSPINSGAGYTPSNSTLPDNEDLNTDNTINQLEEYYEYKIKIAPDQFAVGKNHIVDRQLVLHTTSNAGLASGDTVKWYLFRIPIRTPDSTVGNISGFKSIRYVRMYLTGFSDPIMLRMAQLQFSANQWRVYQYDDINPPSGTVSVEPSGAVLTVSTVNVEENSQFVDGKCMYQLPPGFKRDQDVTSMVNRRLNEQSLQLCIDDLEDGKSKGAYKNVNYNFLNYERVKMFVHGESKDVYMKDGQMYAFLRVGTDNTSNYYEISVPLKLSDHHSTNPNDIWPVQNEIDFAITDLTNVKLERNKSINNDPTLKVFSYSKTMPNGQIITVVGNPDLSTVQTLMIGLRNPYNGDKKTATACIWADELRLTGFVSNPSYATTARMNLKLADLATVNLSGKYTTVGWGALDQKVSQRERINTGQWGVQSNIALDKFIPEKVGLKLPMFVSFDQTLLAPKYDPLDPDVLLKNSLANISDAGQRSDYKSFVMDKTNRHSINFTNIQKVRTKKDAKPHIYDIENLSLTTAYSVTKRTNINIKDYTQKYYKGELVYAFNSTPKNYEPLKNAKWAQSKYLKLIRDLNVTPLPSTLSFRSSLERRLTRTQYYEGNPRDHIYQDPLFEKQFTFTRNYGVNWSLTKSLTLDFKANAYSIIDEPNRDPNIDKKDYNDSLLSNVLRGGRLKNYDHQVGATYKLPIDKIPFTDWVSADAKYSAGYAWASGALRMRDTLGNVIQNNQTSGVTGKVNLEKIYNKVKFLRDINNPPPRMKAGQKDTSKTLPKREWKGIKAMAKTLMLVKNINFTYDITRATTLPGYMPIPKYMGFTPGGNSMEMAPFIFGSQSPDIRYIAANNGWLSKSYSLNSPFTQNKMRSFIAKTQIEPVKDMRIQVDMSVKKSTNYQELYKWHYLDSLNAYSGYGSLSPNRTGSISISVVSIRTAFAGTVKGSGDPNSSSTFAEFERDRDIIRGRMPHISPYDTNSQNVLLPAFLAAYTKRDPHKVAMNPYPSFPMPNWRIDYQGLTRIKAIKKIFPSFTISHAYQSTYNINNYNSSLKYGSDTINPYNDLGNSPFPGLTNSSGASIPVYIIEAVNITEAFNPLIGINFRTNKKLTGNFQLRRARTITLNLNNVQVQEILSTDVTVGIGVIKTNTKLPFLKIPPLKNELNAKMDIVIGNRKTIQRKFDQAAAITAGNLNIQIRPNITYAINQRVNVMMYFERTINSPKISSSYKNSSTRFGFQVRFTLS